jgi:hypothetical protein
MLTFKSLLVHSFDDESQKTVPAIYLNKWLWRRSERTFTVISLPFSEQTSTRKYFNLRQIAGFSSVDLLERKNIICPWDLCSFFFVCFTIDFAWFWTFYSSLENDTRRELKALFFIAHWRCRQSICNFCRQSNRISHFNNRKGFFHFQLTKQILKIKIYCKRIFVRYNLYSTFWSLFVFPFFAN